LQTNCSAASGSSEERASLVVRTILGGWHKPTSFSYSGSLLASCPALTTRVRWSTSPTSKACHPSLCGLRGPSLVLLIRSPTPAVPARKRSQGRVRAFLVCIASK
jgi:hypothetical protein